MKNKEEITKAIKELVNAKEDINEAIHIIIEKGNPQSDDELWDIGKEINNNIDTVIRKSNTVYDRYINYIIAAKNIGGDIDAKD